jgi:general secretion pathway protein L
MYSIRPAIIMSFLLTASIASFFLKDIIMLTKLNHEMYALDTIINKAYFQFFPTAKTVISPKFRLTEWIKHQKDNSDDIFFHLITGIDAYLDKKAHSLLQLTFKNNRMQLALSSIDFASLDTFQNQLKKVAIRSKLIQSSNKNHRVISSLELSL